MEYVHREALYYPKSIYRALLNLSGHFGATVSQPVSRSISKPIRIGLDTEGHKNGQISLAVCMYRLNRILQTNEKPSVVAHEIIL